ncbi:MAG: FAD-dependent monooxygenase, partial [Gammaproteobacteria bacterium]
LGAALFARLDAAAIDWHCPATVTAVNQTATQVSVNIETVGASGSNTQQLTTRLLIGADGSQSQLRDLLNIATRSKDYGQTAIVSSVATASAHADTAYERFTDSGPLALLPRRDGRSVVVCCLPTEQAAAAMRQSDSDFLQLLQQRFGQRLGRFSEPAARQSYPIRLVQAQEQCRGRVLLLGNAVHTVHPNAAQGFNLGLHDASALAALLASHAQTADQDPGSAALLSAYLAEREPVQRRVVQFTDWLAWWFYQPHTLLAPARTAGMLAIDKLPAVKQRFIRRLTGFGGQQWSA